MQTETPAYEYRYESARLPHTHAYISKLILSMLPQCKGQEKLRVLDLGCGNGSLTNFIAQQGYEVIGMEESPSGVEIAQRNFPDC